MRQADTGKTTASRPVHRRAFLGAVAVLIVGAIATTTFALQRSDASFTGSTPGPTGKWSTGSLQLSTSAAALTWTPGFYAGSAPGLLPTSSTDTGALLPGSVGNDCVAINYTGNVNAQLSLYATVNQPTTMAGALQIQIQEGTDSAPGAAKGADSSCSGFNASTTDFPPSGWAQPTHTITDMIAHYGSASSTLPITWAAPASGGTEYFRIAWALDPSVAPGASLGQFTLCWTAAST